MDWASILVSAAFSGLFQMLFDRAAPTKFINIFGFDQNILKNLKIHVLTLEAVLIDAEKKQITNLRVKDWVNRIEDVAYDAEDQWDEVCNFLRKSEANQADWYSIDKVKQIPYKIEVRSRFAKIVTELKFLASQRDLLNLKQSVIGKPPPMLPTTYLVCESEVVGRVDDIRILKKELLTDNAPGNRIPVIAIVGIGGVGKTTLAQLLYNDSDVVREFGLRAWAHVSEEFDVFNTTRTIYESITLTNCNDRDLSLLQIKLHQRLMGKKFLLILDNVWNEKYIDWDLLSSPLKDGAAGSRIVVTTRNQHVAALMGAVFTYPVSHLSNDDCWLLFARHAFRVGNHEKESFKSIGKQIVEEKCKGLPLAAKTLGGLLNSKKEEDEWRKISNSEIWDLPEDNGILPALRLSYYHLPSQLKRCFNYCSIFPKGYEFDKDKLVLLWMAQGFLLPQPKETMKQLGRAYFRELLSRSFFQKSGMNELYVMHDLINDLAQFTCSRVEKARHHAWLATLQEGPEEFLFIHESKPLRTFLSLRQSKNTGRFLRISDTWGQWLQNLKHLRVLSISGYAIVTLPPSLGDLIQLRYLDVSHTLIMELPSSTWSLFNLQTLLLSFCYFLEVPPENFLKLASLRHLDLRETKLTAPGLESNVVVS